MSAVAYMKEKALARICLVIPLIRDWIVKRY